ncbi:MAG: S-layer homology domain-containing protein [Syntrophomonadaceae bacterium]|nr:S-layer homology domain-containing protein [Syntrophomonadaceae bacterium]
MAATCTTTGKTEGSHCSVCSTVLTAQQTINALGHDYADIFTIDTAATCTTAGSQSKHCSRCDSKAEVTVISATGHSWGEWQSNNDGTETRVCTRDGSHTETKNSTFTITYAGMGGATHGENHPGTHTYGAATAISDPTKTGYTFEGWKVNGGNAVKSLTLAANGYTADITLTATWTLNAPTVSLAADKASVTYGTSVKLTATPSHAASGVTYTYEWYKDNSTSAISGQSSSTLTLTTVADSGSYTVKVTASDGALTSAQTTSSAVTVAIGKAAHGKPNKPTENSKTYNSISVDFVTGQKYICLPAADDAPTTETSGWLADGSFTGLSPNTAYKIYTYKPAADGNHTASAVSAALEVSTDKVKITGLAAPGDTALTDFCTTGDEVKAKLTETAACVSENNGVTTLTITWTAPAEYNADPEAENSFTWSVSAPDNYEFAATVVSSGSVTVTNKAATAVTITGTDKAITYDGNTYNVSQMFDIDANAGTATYSIVTPGSGAGSITAAGILTITKAGTIKIKVATAASGIYAAGSAEATLTVNKGSVTVPTIAGKTYTGQPQTADVTGSTADGSYTVTTNDGGTDAGDYDVVLTLNKPDLYRWNGGDSAAKTLTFTISQAKNEWTSALSCAGFTYDGATTLSPSATPKFDAVSYTYSTTSNGQYSELPTGGIKDAGTYYLKATVTGNTNYAGLTTDDPVEVTIAKVKLTPSVGSVDGREYNGGTDATGTISLAAASGYTMPANESPAATGTFAWTNADAETATVNVTAIALTNAAVNRNYELDAASLTGVPAPGSTKISPMGLTIPEKSLTYNGTTEYTVSNHVTGVSSEKITLTYTLTAKDASEYTHNAAGNGFTLTLSDGNYTVKAAGTLTIEPKELTAPAKTVTYNGGVTFTQEVDGVNSEKIIITYTAYSKNAGEYTFSTAAGAGKYTATASSGNYTVTGGGTLSIEQLEATLTWSGDGTTTYDGNARSVTADVSNKVADDTVSVTVSNGTATNASSTAYTATATALAGDDAENYKLPSSKTTTYTINCKSIEGAEITLGTALTYNGGEQTQTVTGVTVDGLDATFDVSSNTGTDAKDDYTLTVTGNGNFTGTETATWGIAQKALTVTAKAQTITYGDSIDVGVDKATAATLASGHALASVTLAPSGAEVTTVGTITPSAAVIKEGDTVVTDNYAITYADGNLTISAAAITCTAPDVEVTYDGAEHAVAVTPTTVNSQTPTVKYRTAAAGEYTLTDSPAYTNVGAYTVYYQITAPNHAEITGSATVKISPKEIAAVWGNTVSFTYDGSPHAPTATAVTGVTGETVTLSVSGAATDYKADAYTATASIASVTGGQAEAGNYKLTDTTQNFTITKAGLTGVSVSQSGTLTYTGLPQTATVTPAATAQGGQSVSFTYSATQGNYGAMPSFTGAGPHTVYYKATAANHDEATGSFTVNISKATLTVGFKSDLAITKIYDGDKTVDNVQTDWLVVNGLQNGETATASGTWAYDSADVSGSRTVSVTAITISYNTATASNYSYTYETLSTSGAITDATMTLAVTGYDKPYDGAAHGISVTMAGAQIRYGTDGVTYGLTSSPTYINADTYTVYYQVTKANYTTVTDSATVKISPKALDASMIGSITDPTYNGGEHKPAPTVSWTPSGGSLLTLTEGSDKDFTFSYANNTNAATASATTKAPTVIITAVEPGNYSGSVSKTFTIDPLTAELQWSGNTDLVYDGEDKTVTATVINKVGDDAFTLDYENNSKINAGSYTAKVTGLGNGNYALPADPTCAFTIDKAPISFTVTGNVYTYNTEPRTATVAQTAAQSPDIDGAFSVTYQLDTETAAVTKTNAGEYAIIVTLTDGNFCFAGEPDEDTRSHTLAEKLVIDKKPVTAQWKNLIHVYDGAAKTPEFVIDGDVFNADSGKVSAELGAYTKTDAGTYTVTASLTGNRADNYALTNPTGSLIIQRAPVTFAVSGNSVQHDSGGHTATVTATANGNSFTDFTVSYKNAKGEAVGSPTDEGSYDIYAAINNVNYRHADASDGAARKIGVLTIYRAAQPQIYTVSFAGGEGATGSVNSLSAALAGTPRVLPPNGFSKDYNSFGGWRYGGRTYQPGETLTQPAADVTLTAVWIEETYLIEGVVDEKGNPLADVVVTLMLGSRQMAQTETNRVGKYSFTDVAPGLYNLVASKNGVTQTILVEIVAEDETDKNITMPAQKTNSVVEVAAGSPAIVVGELEKTFSPEDVEAAKTGSVEIKLTAEAVTESADATAIESKASGTVGLLLEVTLTKTVIKPDGTTDSAASGDLKESPVLLQIVIQLPGELQRKDAYTVYRVHEGVTEALTSSPSENGEYIGVNAEKTAITVYAKYFSTYAIAFTNNSGGGNVHSGTATAYKPVITPTEHGSVTVHPASPVAGAKVIVTLTPEEGYEPASVKVTDRNGKELALTQNSDGTYSFTQPVGAVSIRAAFHPLRAAWNPFSDVAESDWFNDDVRYVYEKGLMQGTGDTAFSPHLENSRGMIVTILWRMENEPKATEPIIFTDVKEGKYYYDAIAWAAEYGIVDGFDADTFGPDRPITREQMAAILYRYAAFKGYDVTATADLSKFADANEIGPWATTALNWANANGLITGKGGGILDPKGDAERCQVAAILHRFCETVAK